MALRKTTVKRIPGGVVVDRAAPGTDTTLVSRAEYFRDSTGAVRLRTKMTEFFVAPRIGPRLGIVAQSGAALRATSAEDLLKVIRQEAGDLSKPKRADSLGARQWRGETVVQVKGPQR
jgi:hypothetical protein